LGPNAGARPLPTLAAPPAAALTLLPPVRTWRRTVPRPFRAISPPGCRTVGSD